MSSLIATPLRGLADDMLELLKDPEPRIILRFLPAWQRSVDEGRRYDAMCAQIVAQLRPHLAAIQAATLKEYGK